MTGHSLPGMGPGLGSGEATMHAAIEGHVRALVRAALAQGATRGPVDAASSVARWHDGIAASLHAVAIDFGTEATSTAAEYGVAALEAGVLYPGDELEAFLREVGGAVRATTRRLATGTLPRG